MSEEKLSFKEKFLFGLSAIPDQLTYQVFQFLIFTFYFTVVQVPTVLMVIAYVLWGIWNAINDPLLGALSERTKHKGKWGKRKFFLLISIIPLCLTMVLLFFVPFSTGDKIAEFFYFLIIITVFEFFYTLFDVNVNALFPEMFPTEKKRASTNLFIKGMTVVALILSALLPAIIVSDYVPDTPGEIALIQNEYFLAAIIVAIITIVLAVPFLIKGIREREESEQDFEKRPSFIESLKVTLTNKTFVKFVIANTMVWYCFSILPIIIPIYADEVIGIDNALLVSIALMLAFVIAALAMPIHRKIGFKIGMRNAFILDMSIWIATLFPFFLITGPEFEVAFIIITAIQGFPLSGALFFVDIIHGDVIDEDALKFGVKRSASYYGINAFIHRISIILVIVTMWTMFGTIGWEKQYEFVVADPFLKILGLKALMFIFPAVALVIGILFMKSYGLHGERLEQMRKQLEEHPELKPR
jgi:GPH family glycoside/pentoside/hexuronide:cation symporter